MALADTLKFVRMGIAKEGTPGTPESAPTEYLYVDKGELIENRPYEDFDALGDRAVPYSLPKQYDTKASFGTWCFPENNGLGHALCGAIGNPVTPARVATASLTYRHDFTVVNTILPSYTVWWKSLIEELQTTYAQFNSLKFNLGKNSKLYMDADIVGQKENTASTFGTFAVSTASNRAFRSGIGQVLFDDVARANVTEFSLNIENNIAVDDAKVIGMDYPKNFVAGKRKVSGSMKCLFEDTVERVAAWGSATGPSPVPTQHSLDLIFESATIESILTPTTAVKEGGTGATVTLTPSGTLTGGGRAFFEVKITTAGTPDKFMWRKNWGAWSAEVSSTGSAQLLSDAISITLSQSTGCVVGDRWSFVVGDIPYRLDFELPSCRISNFKPDLSGGRITASFDFLATIQSSTYSATSTPFDIRAKLYNKKTTTY